MGDKILDIGSGSGWQTALLAHLVGKNGKIFSVEIISELFKWGKKNVESLGFKNIKFILGDGLAAAEKYEPFDKIIAGASADDIPKVLRQNLKVGGRLVLPVKNSIWLLIKKSENKFQEKEFPGFIFVPLV